MHSMRAWIMAAALAASSFPASAGIADAWFARSEFGEEPTCALFGRGSADPQTLIRITIVWTASEGALLRLNGRLSGTPSVKLESVGTPDQWQLTLDRPRPGMAARDVVIGMRDLDTLVANLGREHGLAITVSQPGQPPLRYLDDPGDRKIAVAMYRACIESMTRDPPPRYSKWPGMYLGQVVDDTQCGFRHVFADRSFAPHITLWVDATRGRIASYREVIEATSHGKVIGRRKTPDRVNAEALFGTRFDLVESFEFELTLPQVDAIAADLERGAARKVVMTSPEGDSLILPFGGIYAKASAAMLAACREVKFGTPEKVKQ